MELQKQLRSSYDARLGEQAVPIDGVLGAATVAAIKEVQKRAGLVPDGIVNYPTWLAIVREFEEYQALVDLPQSIRPFPPGLSYKVEGGEISDLVMIIQIILNALSFDYDEIELREISGIYDEATQNAVRAFQVRNNLSPDGVVDKATWNALARAYEKYRDVSQ